tara:strand:+ start:3124 stop:4248 length:1125 start_codon:yes stop_codon:yes gene_type:complete
MTHIHWLGAGLSSIPGIRRLASKKNSITVWNRTLEKAEKSINHVNLETAKAKKLDFALLEKEVQEGDIIVSQLSANMHSEVAKLCLKKNTHFATTSYLSNEIKNLNNEAKSKGLVFINEIGLDPGIDHFFTHLLVNDLNNQNLSNINVSYKSYCGGVPAEANDFKYKFSWSPVGVIKALNNTAIFVQDFNEKKISKPYENISNYEIFNEMFEAYPNRNSIPYIKEYLFPESWKIKEFVRGTLRLNGWSNAWNEIFLMLNTSSNNLEKKIVEKGNELWAKYKYQQNEKDRVVLWVNLEAEKEGKIIWSGTYHLDEKGSGENTAMAKLVSITLSSVLDLMIENRLKPGVQAAPHSKDIINYIFKVLSDYSIKINHQ